MGSLSARVGPRPYVDTNVFIYALEAHPAYVETVRRFFAAADQGACRVLASELVLAEALVTPLRIGNLELVDRYLRHLLRSRSVELLPIGREILIDAARQRAVHAVRLPDAIHAATAIRSACTSFITNDLRLRTVPGLQVVTLEELGREPD